MSTNFSEPLVSIFCTAFNQERYIGRCLEGFVSQKTSFPFEVIVSDDASPDRTAEIIRDYERRYPDIIKPIYYDRNQYSQGINIYDDILAHSRGKYVAFCEGDDFWCDERKLEDQVVFLEQHPDYGVSSTDLDVFYEESGYYDRAISGRNLSYAAGHHGSIEPEALLSRRYEIRTMTVVIRGDLYRKALAARVFKEPWLMFSDTPLWVELSRLTRFHYLSRVCAVYRRHVGTTSNSGDLKQFFRFTISGLELRLYYINEFGATPEYCAHVQKKYNDMVCRYRLFDPDFAPFFPLGKLSGWESWKKFSASCPCLRRLMRGREYLLNFLRNSSKNIKKRIRAFFGRPRRKSGR